MLTKAELIALLEKLPDDVQIFSDDGPYDVLHLKIFLERKDEKFISWFFGP